MRRIVILFAILPAGATTSAALWIFRGREISSFMDRCWTVETQSAPIQSIAYEGSGTGGNLICDGMSFSLNDVRSGLSPRIGSTKDNQLALATGGKVFRFGPLTPASENTGGHLVPVPPAGDQPFLSTRHSVLSWPTPFETNLMTGHSPS